MNWLKKRLRNAKHIIFRALGLVSVLCVVAHGQQTQSQPVATKGSLLAVSFSSGTSTTALYVRTVSTFPISIDAPLPTGTNIIGRVNGSTIAVQCLNVAGTAFESCAGGASGGAVTTISVNVDSTTAINPTFVRGVSAFAVTSTATVVTSLPALVAGSASIGTVVAPLSTRSDTFTGTGNGTTIDVSAKPPSSFAIAVKGTGAAATTWDIRLEGSLDNANFTQILAHTNTTGDGVVLYSGATLSPSLYIRSRASGLVLGGATNVVVVILGVQ